MINSTIKIVLRGIILISLNEIIYRSMLQIENFQTIAIIYTIIASITIYLYIGVLSSSIGNSHEHNIVIVLLLSLFGHVVLRLIIFIVPIFVPNIPMNVAVFHGMFRSYPFVLFLSLILVYTGFYSYKLISNIKK